MVLCAVVRQSCLLCCLLWILYTLYLWNLFFVVKNILMPIYNLHQQYFEVKSMNWAQRNRVLPQNPTEKRLRCANFHTEERFYFVRKLSICHYCLCWILWRSCNKRESISNELRIIWRFSLFLSQCANAPNICAIL